jgi:hypothetical protein
MPDSTAEVSTACTSITALPLYVCNNEFRVCKAKL